MSTPKNKFDFCTRVEYFEQLADLVAQTKKGDRVAVATMSFKPDEPLVDKIMDELCSASRRGVEVRFLVDSFSFLLTDNMVPGPLLFGTKIPNKLPKPYSTILMALEKLAASGTKYTLTNRPSRPFTNPFAGRSHMKFASINDHVYIGGCNLTEANNTDLMVHWQDHKIADWLFELTGVIHNKNKVYTALKETDLSIPIDINSTLLVDAGRKNRSLIFENALQVIDEAKKYIIMACQYSPNGVMARHLSRAIAKGVDVRLIYNYPGNHTFPRNILQTGVKQFEKHRSPTVLFEHELPKSHDYLHAKLLATEKACMIGSHNYIKAGVSFGTAEIALLSTGPDFTKQAVDTLEKQLL